MTVQIVHNTPVITSFLNPEKIFRSTRHWATKWRRNHKQLIANWLEILLPVIYQKSSWLVTAYFCLKCLVRTLTASLKSKSDNTWTTPCMVPNWESSPSVNSIIKNRMAHKLPAGNWLTASVKSMKANPVPEAELSSSSSRLHLHSRLISRHSTCNAEVSFQIWSRTQAT